MHCRSASCSPCEHRVLQLVYKVAFTGRVLCWMFLWEAAQSGKLRFCEDNIRRARPAQPFIICKRLTQLCLHPWNGVAIHTYMCMPTCVHARHAYMRACKHECMSEAMNVCVHACVYACACMVARMCVCAYVCMYVRNVM